MIFFQQEFYVPYFMLKEEYFMSNRELSKLFVVFTLIGTMVVSFSACTRAGGPTGGASKTHMQQQQQKSMQQQKQPSQRGITKQSPTATQKQSPVSYQKRTTQPGKSQKKGMEKGKTTKRAY
jgi:hypothetical protein